MSVSSQKQNWTSAVAKAADLNAHDRERMLPEVHSSTRDDFARDRARVLHSSAFRRLAAKTQVLSPTAGLDVARNRLTHSLEVAQVGREIGSALGLEPDVVDTACLAHDIGHPPFGHNGERALNDWAENIGGFEGNAQNLRILTRLEPKIWDADGRSYGLNLTRATLDAAGKYPWPKSDGVLDPGGRVKFGVYDDDIPVFEWLRQGAPEGRTSIEAQVMDLSDDIAYSVHDFEDAIVSGYLNTAALTSEAEREGILNSIATWAGAGRTDELDAAFDRLAALEFWPSAWDASRRASAELKNLTSTLIGRFASAATSATREAAPQASLGRFGANVVVPESVRMEIAVLKGIVATFVMSNDARIPVYTRQREVLTELADAVWAAPEERLEASFSGDWAAAKDDNQRRRVVVDQVASLTDQSALSWHARYCGGPDTDQFDRP